MNLYLLNKFEKGAKKPSEQVVLTEIGLKRVVDNLAEDAKDRKRIRETLMSGNWHYQWLYGKTFWRLECLGADFHYDPERTVVTDSYLARYGIHTRNLLI